MGAGGGGGSGGPRYEGGHGASGRAGQKAYSTKIWADLGRFTIGRAAERRLDSRTLHRLKPVPPGLEQAKRRYSGGVVQNWADLQIAAVAERWLGSRTLHRLKPVPPRRFFHSIPRCAREALVPHFCSRVKRPIPANSRPRGRPRTRGSALLPGSGAFRAGVLVAVLG